MSSKAKAEDGKNESPKRPLSSYNLFFLLERKRIIEGTDGLQLPVTPQEVRSIAMEHENKPRRRHRKSHGVISFKELARTLAERWKSLEASKRKVFEEQASALWGEYEERLQDYNLASPVQSSLDSGAPESPGREEPRPDLRLQQEAQVVNMLQNQQRHPEPSLSAQQVQVHSFQQPLQNAYHNNNFLSDVLGVVPNVIPSVAQLLFSQNTLSQNSLHSGFASHAALRGIPGLDHNGMGRLNQASYYAASVAASAAAACGPTTNVGATNIYHENSLHILPQIAKTSSSRDEANAASSSASESGTEAETNDTRDYSDKGSDDAEQTRKMVQDSISLYLAAQGRSKGSGKRMRSSAQEGPRKKKKKGNEPVAYQCDPRDPLEVTDSRIHFCVRGKPMDWKQGDVCDKEKNELWIATETLFQFHLGSVPKFSSDKLLSATLVFCFPHGEDITAAGEVDALGKFVLKAVEGLLFDTMGQIVSLQGRKKYAMPNEPGYTSIVLEVDSDFSPTNGMA